MCVYRLLHGEGCEPNLESVACPVSLHSPLLWQTIVFGSAQALVLALIAPKSFSFLKDIGKPKDK